MKKPTVVPREFSREFRADEMFFSTTDTRGVITAGNEVFTRISGYAAEQLIGQAHNIIRHPEMPRAAFRLVWRYLKDGKRSVALVKNLARDGCYYWVVALFAPTPDGYVSIRFKPTGPLVSVITTVYAAMLAEEESRLAGGADEPSAMDASTAILVNAIRARGFADYDAFMHMALCDELKSRDAVLEGLGSSIIRRLPAETPTEAAMERVQIQLRALYRRGSDAYSQLRGLFLRLDEFVALEQSLARQASFVDNLTHEMRIAAMNASLASTRVGSEGQSLSVISHYMGSASAEVGGSVSILTAGLRTVSDQLRSVIFNLAAARLQIEMILTFLHELITNGHQPQNKQTAGRSIRTLQSAFRHSLEGASRALGEIGGNTRQLNPTAQELGRHMLELQVAQLSGVVETTRLTEKGDFNAVFSHIRELINGTLKQLSGLGDALNQLAAIAAETPAAANRIATSAQQMEAEAMVLTA